MSCLHFKGRDQLIAAIDDAVEQGCSHAITQELRTKLCKLIRGSEVELPACVFEACEEHYARREIYTSEEHGYSVICMTWGPGQGTAIHDHSGMWCVEGVWAGELEVVQYDLVEKEGDSFKFRPVGAIQAGQGSAGSLIPPHEYHTIANPQDDKVAISVHIYSGEMVCCNTFEHTDHGWYRKTERTLSLDA